MADNTRPSARSGCAASDASDLRLLEQIGAGHAPALDALLDRYWMPLVTYAARLLGNWDAASDLAQETFIRVWERRESWKPEGSVRALLFQITRNLALDERKRRDRRATWISTRQREEAPHVTLPSEHLQEMELQTAFEHALAALPERRREVFLLARTHGLSYRQIAEIMEIAPQTVANQLSAALAALRDVLEPFLDETGHPASPSAQRARPNRK